jgi:prolyl oligopeptidase
MRTTALPRVTPAVLSLFNMMIMTIMLSMLFVTGVTSQAAAQDITYPETQRIDHIDEYHGTTVADPYRWLENDVRTDAAVAEWVEDQNEVTNAYLDTLAQREEIRERLTTLWDYEKFSAPFKAGGRYFVSRNDGLQNQFVLYMLESLYGEPKVLFDPNTWSADGTIALAGFSVSDDGRYAAYGRSEAGSDWKTWRIRDLDSNTDLPEVLEWIKWSGASWTPDGRGFFYTRYDEPDEGAFVAVNEYPKVYYHRIGTSQSEDVLVHENPREPKWGFSTEVTDDGRYLLISVTKGTGDNNLLRYRDLTEPYGMMQTLIDEWEAEYSYLGNDGPVMYFKTDYEAQRGRIIAIDLRKPERANWKELVPESEDTLRGVNLVANMFVASYLDDAKTAVRLYDMRGEHVRDVEFPTLGTASGFGGKRGDTETFYSFTSFATPPSTYRYDLITGQSAVLQRADVDFDPGEFVTRQVFYTSKDGTQVPMFICHKRGLELDGNNATLLYGYGGFDIALTPSFSISRLAWMEMGGVFAMPNLRGGGEYGEAWHHAGTKLQKQNVFDDFIAAAEWLIANKYTQPSRLAIQGGSNGGLLVGACMAQRPDLYGACLPAVGVMDMLRFHKFTIGWAWVDDYGSSDDPAEFEALYAYSPYHTLTPGTEYPATLITTADTDDRVVPGHSFKFAAALQYAQSGEAPVLIRIETRAGHGAGKPTSKIIEEVADQWAFLAKNLGMSMN